MRPVVFGNIKPDTVGIVALEDDERRTLEAVLVQAPIWRRAVADAGRRRLLAALAARGLLVLHGRGRDAFWTLGAAGVRAIAAEPRHWRHSWLRRAPLQSQEVESAGSYASRSRRSRSASRRRMRSDTNCGS